MKKLKKDILGLTQGVLIIGAGAKVTRQIGGNVQGFSALSKHFPTMGNLMGAGASLRMLSKLKRKKK